MNKKNWKKMNRTKLKEWDEKQSKKKNRQER